ncbi:o-succinylbenzoate synthase [Nostocoides jenkinsii]|jgi:O-succinylbenzoate synthase|uniref:o-succinylbenzoate synthase n=1 Tax=Nostocoides jenkinsii Ben 74 TaxID=1193518 RepID=A0A077MB74_9MICO|nr:o-succinylbenzoate synthase [Tetrasphaera jenkinsii]CCI54601.1 o-succinylbenzoate synthase [Tetrasphaera jenkinsii Ben 74]
MTAPLPDRADLLGRVHVVAIPMRVRFRGITAREVALIDGPAGWGEFGPFPEYAVPEAARWLASAIEAAYGAWPAPVRESVPINATVPAVGPEAVAGIVARFPGCDTVKVKVAEPGQPLGEDVARVAEVRAVMGPRARIRLDANGNWSLAEAAEALERLGRYDLDYVEQPCASVRELAALRRSLARRGIRIRIAADESIRKAEDPLRVAREEAADLVVVKVAPLGGVARTLEIVEACGLPAVVSSALDTSIGLSAGVALAAALPELAGACGLGTLALMEGDVTTASLRPVGGVLAPGRVAADPDLLHRYAAPPPRVAWWHERVRACLAELTR